MQLQQKVHRVQGPELLHEVLQRQRVQEQPVDRTELGDDLYQCTVEAREERGRGTGGTGGASVC